MNGHYLKRYHASFKCAELYTEAMGSIALDINGRCCFSQHRVTQHLAQLAQWGAGDVLKQRNIQRIALIGLDNPALGWMIQRSFPAAHVDVLGDTPRLTQRLLKHPHLYDYGADLNLQALEEHAHAVSADLIIFASVQPLSRQRGEEILQQLNIVTQHNMDAAYLMLDPFELVTPEYARKRPSMSVMGNEFEQTGNNAWKVVNRITFLEQLQDWHKPEHYIDALNSFWFADHAVYPYRQDTLHIEFDDLPMVLRSSEFLPEWIELLSSDYDLIFYANGKQTALEELLLTNGFRKTDFQLDRWIYPYNSENATALNGWAARLPFDKYFKRFRLVWCAPDEDPDVEVLLREYLLDHQNTFFDIAADVDLLMQQKALFYLFYDLQDRPVGMVKVIHHSQWREAEIIYCRGSARQNIAVMVYGFIEDQTAGVDVLEINVPYQHVGDILQKLGARHGGVNSVFSRFASAE